MTDAASHQSVGVGVPGCVIPRPASATNALPPAPGLSGTDTSANPASLPVGLPPVGKIAGNAHDRFRKSVRHFLWSTSEYRIYRIAPTVQVADRSELRVGRNDWYDLCRYEAAGTRMLKRSVFLDRARARIDEGQIAYTIVIEGRLAHYSWLNPCTNTFGTSFDVRLGLPENSAVLWDAFTFPGPRNTGLHKAAIQARLHDLAQSAQVKWAFCGALASNLPSRHNLEQRGFGHCASVWEARHVGFATHWTTGSCGV